MLARAHVFQLPKDLPSALLTSGYWPATGKDCQPYPAHAARGGSTWLSGNHSFTHLGGSGASLFPQKQGPPKWFQEYVAAQFPQADKLWKLEVCSSSPSPFSAERSFPNRIGLQPPKTFLVKGNRTQCQVKLRWKIRKICSYWEWNSWLNISTDHRRWRFAFFPSVVGNNGEKQDSGLLLQFSAPFLVVANVSARGWNFFPVSLSVAGWWWAGHIQKGNRREILKC